jgi:hypothetical protein
MSANEIIAEAFRRGINLKVNPQGALEAFPMSGVEQTFVRELLMHAPEIIAVLTGATPVPITQEKPGIIKVLKGNDARMALADAVLKQMGLQAAGEIKVGWFPCTTTGDVRVEIVGPTEPRQEGWK